MLDRWKIVWIRAAAAGNMLGSFVLPLRGPYIMGQGDVIEWGKVHHWKKKDSLNWDKILAEDRT